MTMSAATVTDITTATAKKEKAKSDNISLSIMLPEDLYDKVMLDSILSKSPIGPMVEDWIDQNVSLQDVTVGLATLMKNNTVREKVVPGVTMKGLSVPVSKRHYGMIRMEALRQNTTIRSLLKNWIIENTREWNYEPVENQDWQDRQAA
jgi:BarA-like signal transduction histidine kinase